MLTRTVAPLRGWPAAQHERSVFIQVIERGTELKIFRFLIIAVTAFLSIAAGLAKVMQTQQEMEFLQGAGLSPAFIVVFGLVQIAGGALLVPGKTRMVGAVLAASAFVVSAVLIFISGNLAFGLFSTVPIVLAGVIFYQTARASYTKPIESAAKTGEASDGAVD